MITALTDIQKERVSLYQKKWWDIARSTEKLDKEKVKKGIEWVYEYAGKKKPDIIYCETPVQAQRLAVKLKEEKRSFEEMKHIFGDKDKLNEYVKGCIYREIAPYFAPPLEATWVAFYDYLLNEVFPEQKEKFAMFLDHCINFYTHVYFIIPYENICITSERDPLCLPKGDQK